MSVVAMTGQSFWDIELFLGRQGEGRGEGVIHRISRWGDRCKLPLLVPILFVSPIFPATPLGYYSVYVHSFTGFPSLPSLDPLQYTLYLPHRHPKPDIEKQENKKRFSVAQDRPFY